MIAASRGQGFHLKVGTSSLLTCAPAQLASTHMSALQYRPTLARVSMNALCGH
jgi:hypothetical protein